MCQRCQQDVLLILLQDCTKEKRKTEILQIDFVQHVQLRQRINIKIMLRKVVAKLTLEPSAYMSYD